MPAKGLINMSVFMGLDLTQFQSGIQKAQRQLSGFGSKMNKIGQGLSLGISAPLLGVGAAGLKAASDLEQTEVAFTTMLKSGEKAKGLLEDLQKFAASTPFQFPEIAKASKSLLAFGVTAENIPKTLKAIGDISAGIGAPIGEISELYGKAKVQGRLFAEDINQLTGRGIPIIQELAKQFGVAESEVKKLVESGKVNFKNLETAFQSLTSEGGQFADLMKAQSNTLGGVFSTLQDNLGLALTEIGNNIVETFDLKNKLKGAIDIVQGLTERFKNLSPEMKKIITIGGAVLAAIGPLMVALGTLSTTIIPALIGGFTLLTGPVGLVIAGIAALSVAAIALYKNWEQVTAFFNTGSGSKTFSKLKETVASTFESIKDIGAKFKAFFITLWDEFGGVIQSTFINVLVGAADVVGHVFTAIAKNLDAFLKFMKGDVKGGFESFKESWKEIGLAVARIVITMVDNILITLGKLVSYIPGVGETFQKGFNKAREALAGLTNKLFETTEEVEKNTDKTKEGFEETTKEVDKTTSSIVALGGAGAAALNKTQAAAQSLKNTIAEIAAATEKSLFGNSFSESEQKLLGKQSGFILGKEDREGLSKQAGGLSSFGVNRNGQIELGAEEENGLLSSIKDLSPEDFEALEAGNKMADDLNKAFKGLDVTADQMGNTFADAFASTATGAQQLADIIKQTATQIIKSYIAEGIAAIIKTTLPTAPGPIGLALAGAAGAAAGALFNKLVPKFAEGGLVSGPTLGLIGEGPGTSVSNPEVIAPLDKLKQYIGGQGGPVHVDVTVEGILRGEDIYLSGQTYQKNVNRLN